MDFSLWRAWRFIPVVIFLAVAAALLTPKGAMPLALRSVLRLFKGEKGRPVAAVPRWKRLVAFLLVLLAFAAACCL